MKNGRKREGRKDARKEIRKKGAKKRRRIELKTEQEGKG
jgi:hypothetical protein